MWLTLHVGAHSAHSPVTDTQYITETLHYFVQFLSHNTPIIITCRKAIVWPSVDDVAIVYINLEGLLEI